MTTIKFLHYKNTNQPKILTLGVDFDFVGSTKLFKIFKNTELPEYNLDSTTFITQTIESIADLENCHQLRSMIIDRVEYFEGDVNISSKTIKNERMERVLVPQYDSYRGRAYAENLIEGIYEDSYFLSCFYKPLEMRAIIREFKFAYVIEFPYSKENLGSYFLDPLQFSKLLFPHLTETQATQKVVEMITKY